MTKHKHYQYIRAYADGWKIKWQYGEDSLTIDNPGFIESYSYQIVPDSEGWLPWYGPERPSKQNDEIEIKYFKENCWFYRPKPTPKTKAIKIKLLAYFSPSGSLYWYTEGTDITYNWKRVPSEDKIIEVEDA